MLDQSKCGVSIKRESSKRYRVDKITHVRRENASKLQKTQTVCFFMKHEDLISIFILAVCLFCFTWRLKINELSFSEKIRFVACSQTDTMTLICDPQCHKHRKSLSDHRQA